MPQSMETASTSISYRLCSITRGRATPTRRRPHEGPTNKTFWTDKRMDPGLEDGHLIAALRAKEAAATGGREPQLPRYPWAGAERPPRSRKRLARWATPRHLLKSGPSGLSWDWRRVHLKRHCRASFSCLPRAFLLHSQLRASYLTPRRLVVNVTPLLRLPRRSSRHRYVLIHLHLPCHLHSSAALNRTARPLATLRHTSCLCIKF